MVVKITKGMRLYQSKEDISIEDRMDDYVLPVVQEPKTPISFGELVTKAQETKGFKRLVSKEVKNDI